MSSGKIIGSIVVVILGCALIPAGFLTNNYLQGQVTAGIPQVLSGIRNATVPQIEEMAKEEGTPDALLQIQSETTPQIAQMVTSEGTPAALVQCENGLMGT
ncbi:MAG TPA: hypothetical protein VKK79_02215, partial [Candidatus Lokiarchaeia archaeon]|nr:hypothetical protein [Candidatus Lokiarchaeia archaeon]